MFQAPVPSSFPTSSYPEATAYAPEGGYVPGMSSVVGHVESYNGNAYDGTSYFMPGQSSQEQEMQESATDGADIFAPSAPEPVKVVEAVPAPLPCTNSPTISDGGVSEMTIVEATPNLVSNTGSCGPTPAVCDGEFVSVRAASEQIDPFSVLSKSSEERKNACEETKQAGSVVKAVNFSCSVSLGCKLSIRQIALQLMNVDWNPKRPNGAIVRLSGGAIGQIHSNGTVQVKFAKSEREAQMSMSRLIRKIKRACPSLAEINVTKMHVNEISARCELGRHINVMDMDIIPSETFQSSVYDPNRSAFRTISLRKPQATLMLCHTGSGSVHGVRTREDLDKAIEVLCDLSKKYSA